MSRNNVKKKGKFFCDHCHGDLHTKERCFYLHGYPNWHTDFGSKPDPAKMPKYKNKPVIKSVANTAAINPTTCANVTSINSTANVDDLVTPTFTNSQYQQLLSLLNSTGLDSPESHLSHMAGKLAFSHNSAFPGCLASLSTTLNEWIIDTGATDHITYFFELLVNPVAISSNIHLPIGKPASITHKGSIHLSHDLVIHNVLYIPDFKFNLLSGHKLAFDNNYALIFYSSHCVIQDLVQKKQRGISKADGGLYKLI